MSELNLPNALDTEAPRLGAVTSSPRTTDLYVPLLNSPSDFTSSRPPHISSAHSTLGTSSSVSPPAFLAQVWHPAPARLCPRCTSSLLGRLPSLLVQPSSSPALWKLPSRRPASLPRRFVVVICLKLPVEILNFVRYHLMQFAASSSLLSRDVALLTLRFLLVNDACGNPESHCLWINRLVE